MQKERSGFRPFAPFSSNFWTLGPIVTSLHPNPRILALVCTYEGGRFEDGLGSVGPTLVLHLVRAISKQSKQNQIEQSPKIQSHQPHGLSLNQLQVQIQHTQSQT